MKKTVVMTIKVSVAHVDSIPALLSELSDAVNRENDKGMLEKEDGDTIKWETK